MSGNQVIGQASGSGFDANDTFELVGTFWSLTVTAPVVMPSDGVSVIFATKVADAAVPESFSLIVGGISALAFAGRSLRRRKQAASKGTTNPLMPTPIKNHTPLHTSRQ